MYILFFFILFFNFFLLSSTYSTSLSSLILYNNIKSNLILKNNKNNLFIQSSSLSSSLSSSNKNNNILYKPYYNFDINLYPIIRLIGPKDDNINDNTSSTSSNSSTENITDNTSSSSTSTTNTNSTTSTSSIHRKKLQDNIILGDFTPIEALKIAQNKNLDLILVNEKQLPPVCKLLNYGKYKYNIEKKLKNNNNNNDSNTNINSHHHRQVLKEIKISYNIDSHDFLVKLKAINKFLLNNDRVKVVIQFKGRELEAHSIRANELLNEIISVTKDISHNPQPPVREGRYLILVLNPKSKNHRKGNGG